MKRLESLEAWSVARRLAGDAYRLTLEPPLSRHYSLSDQIRRAAPSIPANIAEGYGRFHYLDNAKFCSNSRGSCWEILDHLIAGYDEGFISAELLERGRSLVADAIKVLNGYMKYLKSAPANTINQ